MLVYIYLLYVADDSPKLFGAVCTSLSNLAVTSEIFALSKLTFLHNEIYYDHRRPKHQL